MAYYESKNYYLWVQVFRLFTINGITETDTFNLWWYLFFQNTFVLNIKNNGRPGSPIKFDFCWPAFPESQFSKPLWNFHRSMTHQKFGFVIEVINFLKFSVLWNLPEKVSWWELWKYFYIFWAALIENYRNRMAYLALKLMRILIILILTPRLPGWTRESNRL